VGIESPSKHEIKAGRSYKEEKKRTVKIHILNEKGDLKKNLIIIMAQTRVWVRKKKGIQ